jgi:hypothetical protein
MTAVVRRGWAGRIPGRLGPGPGFAGGKEAGAMKGTQLHVEDQGAKPRR